MKHTINVTFILIGLFFLAQIIGIAIISNYIDYDKIKETGKLNWQDLPYQISRPVIEEASSFMYILAAVLIGTALVFLLMRFKKIRLWKLWFFLSVWLCLAIAFAAFIPQFFATSLAFILAALKVFKPNIITHNATELFVYGGLAAIFVPVMNLFAVFMLLLLISVYDIYAVWKSKHMITLANFQKDSKVFAGLLIPYKRKEKIEKYQIKKMKIKAVKTAILGGGDLGFPLLFAGVVFKNLALNNQSSIIFLKILPIPIFATIALYWLLMKGKKDKFYPAMPFLSVGCIIGYLLSLWINLLF